MADPKRRYEVLTGLNYPDPGAEDGSEKRAEVGDVVDDLPEDSIDWLLEQGHIAEPQAEPEGGVSSG